MFFLTDALKIAIVKVVETIINITIFRNIYSFIQIWLGGFYGFVLTIFVSGKVRSFIYKNYARIKERVAQKSKKPYFKFNVNSIKSIDLNREDATVIKEFHSYAKNNSHSDLFYCIFSSSSQSAMISFLTFMAVEYLHQKFEMSIGMAIFYSVSVSFILCFGSSFKYAKILIAEWLDELDAIVVDAESRKEMIYTKSTKILLTHKNESDNRVEFIGLWISKFDSHRNSFKVEVKFIKANYLDFMKEILDYYAKHHMSLEKKSTEENNNGTESNRVEKYELHVPDYYNVGTSKLFEKGLKEKGFKSQESWAEFKLFPGVNFNINVYKNIGTKKQKTN